MKIKKFSSVLFCISLAVACFSQETNELEQVSSVYDDWINFSFYGAKIWEEGRSSVLREKGKPTDTYELSKLSDADPATAWVEGVKGDGIGECFYTLVYGPTESYYDFQSDQAKVTLKIQNGFCMNKKLFNENNRVKKVEIRTYDVPSSVNQVGVYRAGKPMLNTVQVVELADTMEAQTFEFNVKPTRDAESEGDPDFLLKFTILEVYHGSKYQDTCISELKATDELVSLTKKTDE